MKGRILGNKFLRIPIILSITLVLFMMKLILIFGFYSKKIVNELKEKLPIEIFLKEEVNKEKLEDLLNSIKSLEYLKNFKYINKNEALKIAEKELGIKKEDLLDNQIFPASIKINLKSNKVDLTQINDFLEKIKSNPNIEEVKHFKNILDQVYSNIKKWSFWLIGFFVLILFMAMFLINNILSLYIYSKRFIIKNMQLIGAKKKFIYGPFLRRSFYWGLLSGFLSLFLLGFILNLLFRKIELTSFPLYEDALDIALLLAGVILFGALIPVISTFFIIRKFLRLKSHQLYL